MNYLFLLFALIFPQLSLAQVEIPAVVRTTIPSGDATGGKADYNIPLGDSNTLRLRVDAGKLSVAVSGSVKDQFALFMLADGDYTPLECSAGFLGKFTKTVTCVGIEPGMRLVFVRKDFVDALVPSVAEDVFAEEGEEGAFDDEEFFDEDFSGEAADEEAEAFFEDNLFTGAFEDVGDLLLAGGEDEFGVLGSESAEFGVDFGDLTFGGEAFDIGGFGDEEFGAGEFDEFSADTEFQPSFGVDLGDLTFGGFEETFEGTDFLSSEDAGDFGFGTEDFTFDAGEDAGVFDEGGFAAEDLLFGAGGDDMFSFEEGAGEEAFTGEGMFGDDVDGFGVDAGDVEEETAAREEKPLRQLLYDAGQAAKAVVVAVQYKVADFFTRLYVKPIPLSPEAQETDAVGEEEIFEFEDEFLPME